MAKAALKIELPRLNLQRVAIGIIGESSLIVHRWSEKAKKAMLDKQTKQARQKKAAKDPEQDFEDSLYHHPEGGYGFPSTAFKNAMVGACRFADGVKMTELRGALHIEGEMVKIDGVPELREDICRIAMGTADLRYRGEFKEWRATLNIIFNANAISAEEIFGLLTLAGFGVGVGEWRPERNGPHGRFRVATEEAT